MKSRWTHYLCVNLKSAIRAKSTCLGVAPDSEPELEDSDEASFDSGTAGLFFGEEESESEPEEPVENVRSVV